MARELCLLADVTAYAPGYQSDAATDALLQRLITSESRSFHERSRREFVAIDPPVNTRRFDVCGWEETYRTVWIGDANTVTTVRILDPDATVLETVVAPGYVTRPRVREEWEPIRALHFPLGSSASASNLIAGYMLEVVGTWGFPAIPADVKEAVAAMVLARYVEIVPSGTLFSESLAEVNIAALFANAQETREFYASVPGL